MAADRNAPEPEDDSHRFPIDPEATRRMVNAAFQDEQERKWACQVLFTALAGTPLECRSCGEFCGDQEILVRDAIFKRAAFLCDTMSQVIDVYQQNRGLGIEEPGELISMVYRTWAELSCLLGQAEPSTVNVVVGGDADEDEEDDEA